MKSASFAALLVLPPAVGVTGVALTHDGEDNPSARDPIAFIELSHDA